MFPDPQQFKELVLVSVFPRNIDKWSLMDYDEDMKLGVIAVLVLLGIYWLVDHYPPMPLSHEQFGLYNHTIHRLMGVAFFIAAAVVYWKWHPKSS